MRWDNLTMEAEERARLPGYRDGAVVRHFDAPEALDVRFYEVRARSALNRVPERSRMPFRWTINPYRGCSHACVYCLAGDTQILLADGRSRALAELDVGDRVYGTVAEGCERRYAVTEVLAHWSTVKPAYRVLLDDATELVASGDHRFLTTRGWAFVARGDPDAAPRRVLTPGVWLLGPGAAVEHEHAPALAGALEAVGAGAPRGQPVAAARATCDAARVRASARVVSVEPLGTELRLYDITTGTGDFVANGVVSHNCFARPTHTYLDMNAGRDFEREIVVKVNAPEVLRTELARPSWKREHVAMGTNTDPYQWVEGRYRLMRGIWEALRDFANPCSVLTKSPLLLRDLDLMLEIAKVTDIAANLSIPTMDEKPWRASEPHTPSPRARMEAVKELNRAGIPTGILVAPLMPGINDAPHQVERILAAAGEAGATGISGIALHLRGEVRGIFMDWLRSYRPDLVERYEALYRRGAYAPRDEQDRLRRLLRTTRVRGGDEPPRRSPADSRGVRRAPPAAPAGPVGQGPPATPSATAGGDRATSPPDAVLDARRGTLPLGQPAEVANAAAPLDAHADGPPARSPRHPQADGGAKTTRLHPSGDGPPHTPRLRPPSDAPPQTPQLRSERNGSPPAPPPGVDRGDEPFRAPAPSPRPPGARQPERGPLGPGRQEALF